MIGKGSRPALLVACALAHGKPSSPNFVLVLTDDEDNYRHSSLDLHRTMPVLKRALVDGGVTFASHVTNSPACGPARASLLTSRLPHNHGYVAMGEANSYRRWKALRGETFGAPLTAAGWHTAYIGKWINDDACANGVPLANGSATWSRWAALCNVYAYYNSSYHEADLLARENRAGPSIRSELGVYQTDAIGLKAVHEIEVAERLGKPFLLVLAGASPHAGPCMWSPSSEKKAHVHPTGGVPQWLREPPDAAVSAASNRTKLQLQDLTSPLYNYNEKGRPCPALRHRHIRILQAVEQHASLDVPPTHPQSFLKFVQSPRFRQLSENGELQFRPAFTRDVAQTDLARLQALAAVDEMLGSVLKKVERVGRSGSTFIFYTSDHGIHMGYAADLGVSVTDACGPR